MGKSATDICNMALSHIGVSTYIADYATEQSREAITCRIFYDNALERALQEIPWRFATRFADLQDLGSPPTGWAYRYAYPGDCVYARYLADGTDTSSYLTANEWTRRADCITDFMLMDDEDNSGLAIVADISPATLCYTGMVTNSQQYPQYFIDAFSRGLARDIAMPISALPNMAQMMGQAYNLEVLKAAARDMNQSQDMVDPVPRSIKARL